MFARLVREAYRHEVVPVRIRWWWAADGMRRWNNVLLRELGPHLGDNTRAVLAQINARMLTRRYDAIAAELKLPMGDERAVPLLMSELYRMKRTPKAAWMFSALGGVAATSPEERRAHTLLRLLDTRKRWEELTVHLGELLVVLTEDLPHHLHHSRRILGEICFAEGQRTAKRAMAAFGIRHGELNVCHAIEILRMSEYLFRVNPKHWGGVSESGTGWLEGTACPWRARPGWSGAHCGIFGQFQAGISSELGLRYHLSKTIPKHGGGTCRIDLKPLR